MSMMDQIEAIFRNAVSAGMCAYVEIAAIGRDETDITVVRPKPLAAVIDTYRKTYNDDGVHRMNDQLKIVRAGITNISM